MILNFRDWTKIAVLLFNIPMKRYEPVPFSVFRMVKAQKLSSKPLGFPERAYTTGWRVIVPADGTA